MSGTSDGGRRKEKRRSHLVRRRIRLSKCELNGWSFSKYVVVRNICPSLSGPKEEDLVTWDFDGTTVLRPRRRENGLDSDKRRTLVESDESDSDRSEDGELSKHHTLIESDGESPKGIDQTAMVTNKRGSVVGKDGTIVGSLGEVIGEDPLITHQEDGEEKAGVEMVSDFK